MTGFVRQFRKGLKKPVKRGFGGWLNWVVGMDEKRSKSSHTSNIFWSKSGNDGIDVGIDVRVLEKKLYVFRVKSTYWAKIRTNTYLPRLFLKTFLEYVTLYVKCYTLAGK